MSGYENSDKNWGKKKKAEEVQCCGVRTRVAGFPPFMKNYGCMCISVLERECTSAANIL